MGYNRYDVVVVGAGVAGCMAAKVSARRGFSTCVVDQKPYERIGEKVCADAIGKHHFDRLGLDYPSGDELRTEVRGVRVFPPSRSFSFLIPGEGFIIDRKQFGRRLLKDALDFGAELRASARALSPAIEEGSVVGIKVKDVSSGRTIDLYADVVVDASGFLPAIRPHVPPEAAMPKRIAPEDYCISYREVRVLKEELDEPDICYVYLNTKTAPGGYAWIFPAGEARANVGLGVQAVEGHPNPRILLREKVLSWPMFDGSEVLDAGGWFIPTRRPLSNMVWNGLIVVGDAACQANPLHGGGIGHSMFGGALAGEVASDALEEGDTGLRALWAYNVHFMRERGARNAELDVFRIFLQKLSDDELEFGMTKKLVSEEDLLCVSKGEGFSLGLKDKLLRALRGARKPGFLRRLSKVVKLMGEVGRHYRSYPEEPGGFRSWEKRAEELFSLARAL